MTKEQAEQFVAFETKFKEANPLFRISETLSMTPYLYGDEISDFIQFCYDNNLVKQDYYLIEKEWRKNKTKAAWFAGLTEEKLVQCIGYIIRGDRFSDGFIASLITSGVMFQIFERVKTIHNL